MLVNKVRGLAQSLAGYRCPAGYAMSGITADLKPQCDRDRSGDVRCAVGFAVAGADPPGALHCVRVASSDDWQLRVRTQCPDGWPVRAVDGYGDPACTRDADTVATPLAFQARGNGTCPPGEALQAVAASGAPACFAQPPIDPAVYQRRNDSAAACAAGAGVAGVRAAGEVACKTDELTEAAGAGFYIHWGRQGCPSETAATVYSGWCATRLRVWMLY
jgi:hypothetical protein